MKVLNMSCKEVLPSLLNLRWYNEKVSKIKTVPNNLEEAIAMADDELKATAGKMLDAIERKPYQDHPIKLSTIRELKEIKNIKNKKFDSLIIDETIRNGVNHKAYSPKFKPGEEAQIMWKQRTSPKDSWFCSCCGEETEICVNDKSEPAGIMFHHDKEVFPFPKLMTTVKTTQVDKLWID